MIDDNPQPVTPPPYLTPNKPPQVNTMAIPLVAFDEIAQAIQDLPLVEHKICISQADADALRSLIASYLAASFYKHNRLFSRYNFMTKCTAAKTPVEVPVEDAGDWGPDDDLGEDDNEENQ